MSTEDPLSITAFAHLREAHAKLASPPANALVAMLPVLFGRSTPKLR